MLHKHSTAQEFGQLGVTFVTSYVLTGLILGLSPANKILRYLATTSLIGWEQA